jgi:endonuclease/exonuclease/phosphatase family metal-dependent hydrolase
MKTLLNSRIGRQVIATILLTLTILTSAAGAQGLSDSGKRGIDVVTVNLYVGADFSPLLALDPSTDPDYLSKLLAGVQTIYSRIHQSSFKTTRADALAREIVRRGPDLVALQEVTLLRRQKDGDSLFGGTVPATRPDLDYLAILLEKLESYGGHYAVVSEIQEVDVELPLLTGPTSFDDVRLTDRDVILARTDLPPGHLRTFNPQAGNFSVLLPLPLGFPALRGWCSVDVQVRGRQFRFINSHLEDRFPVPEIQLAQAYELWKGPVTTTLPLILAGDFNSDANGNYSPETYSLLTTAAGLRDLWGEVGGRSPGLTWGHDSLLQDPNVLFDFRLDWVLFRGPFEPLDAVVVDPVIGTSSPLWFSDHAAVFGTFAIP